MGVTEDSLEGLRAIIGDDPNVSEKRMFGGVAFMLNGNMLCGIMSNGELLFRVGKDLEAEALARPGSRLMQQGGRTMSGFVLVEEEGVEDHQLLAAWIALATRFVATLPPKS